MKLKQCFPASGTPSQRGFNLVEGAKIMDCLLVPGNQIENLLVNGLNCCFLAPPTLKRTNGERSRAVQRSAEAGAPAAHGPALSGTPFHAASRLACHATADAVPRTAHSAHTHGAAPETEPHHACPEAPRAGPCRNPAGARVQVWNLPPNYCHSHMAGLLCRPADKGVGRKGKFFRCLDTHEYLLLCSV